MMDADLHVDTAQSMQKPWEGDKKHDLQGGSGGGGPRGPPPPPQLRLKQNRQLCRLFGSQTSCHTKGLCRP